MSSKLFFVLETQLIKHIPSLCKAYLFWWESLKKNNVILREERLKRVFSKRTISIEKKKTSRREGLEKSKKATRFRRPLLGMEE